MNKEIKSLLKKTVKIAGVTCVAAGAVAVLTSGVALKAIAEGGKYLGDTVRRILNEGEDTTPDVVCEAEPVAEETPAAEEIPAEEL